MYKYYGNMFYPYSLMNERKAIDAWPDDGVDVDEQTFNLFTSAPPIGKTRGTNNEGFPCWVDVPPLSNDDAKNNADFEKKVRITRAQQHISLWQTQLQLGMISDADKASLIAWMNYITALQAVDTSTAPDIDWPTPPDA